MRNGTCRLFRATHLTICVVLIFQSPDFFNKVGALGIQFIERGLLKQDLRTLTKETGFLPNLWTATKYFAKKPGFGAPIVSPI